MDIYLCYGLIVFVALMAAVKVAFQNDFVRNFSKNLADTTLYLAFMFFFIAIVMLFLVDYSNLPEWQTIVMGVIFGLATTIGQITYSYAMKNGPVSLTVLITCFALIVPTGVGLLFWNETLTLTRGIGLVLIALAMVLILYKPTDKKKEDGVGTAEQGVDHVRKRKRYLLWFALTLATFALFGLNNTLQSWHQRIPEVKPELNWFVLISYFTAGVSSLLMIPVSREKVTFKCNKRVILDIACGAVALGIHNYLRPLLSNYVPNTVLQPMANICNILFITLFGVVMFKDKISKMQWLGIVLGVSAVTLLCL